MSDLIPTADAPTDVANADESAYRLTPEDYPNVDHLITEDDAPVDNWYSEKQMRLLTEPLYAGWTGPGEGRGFVVAANVGLYGSIHQASLVPDVLFSLDVSLPDDWWEKRHRVYFVWELGKPPDAVIEIVSNREGGELDEKMARYARLGIAYYVIHDPRMFIQDEVLTTYKLDLPSRRYNAVEAGRLSGLGLQLALWTGVYENRSETWLRWQDEKGELIPTGAERAEAERERADAERERADAERERAERLAARLRALGEDPEKI